MRLIEGLVDVYLICNAGSGEGRGRGLRLQKREHVYLSHITENVLNNVTGLQFYTITHHGKLSLAITDHRQYLCHRSPINAFTQITKF